MTRIVIMGGGPAGYEAALVAAQHGADVTIVERDGLGGACVRLLASAGANVVIADLNQDAGDKLAAEFAARVRFAKTDVTDEKSVQAAVDLAVDEVDPLPSDVHLALYRIVEEALNKVAKHAGASRVLVQDRTSAGSGVVRILDNGRGFDAATLPRGQLSIGVTEVRAKSVGARLRVMSRPGRGTIVAAEWEQFGEGAFRWLSSNRPAS